MIVTGFRSKVLRCIQRMDNRSLPAICDLLLGQLVTFKYQVHTGVYILIVGN